MHVTIQSQIGQNQDNENAYLIKGLNAKACGFNAITQIQCHVNTRCKWDHACFSLSFHHPLKLLSISLSKTSYLKDSVGVFCRVTANSYTVINTHIHFHTPPHQKEHHADSDVGEDNAHPDLVGQRVEEGEDARFGFGGFLDHDGDSQRHERFGEVDHLLSHQSDGQWGNCHVSLLQRESAKAEQDNPDVAPPVKFASSPGGSQGIPRTDEEYNPSSKVWVYPGSPPSWTCLENFQRMVPTRHPDQVPEPPQLSPFDMKVQQLYSVLPMDIRAQAEPNHPTEETHFGLILSVTTQSS